MTAPLRTIACGAGVQSTAMVILAGRGEIDFPVALFANVGDDSEHPATLAYSRDVLAPYAEAHGIEYHELQRHKRDGEVETLMGRLLKEGSRSLPIPVRMSNGAPGQRSCTADFKLRVMTKWHRAHAATSSSPAVVAIGISTDEIHRAANRRPVDCEAVVYPLIDLRLSRNDCQALIAEEGLPIPPKSACYFCPFHDLESWRTLARDEPVLFGKAVDLEATLNERRDLLGKDHVWLTRYNKPLSEVMDDSQGVLPWDLDEPETCDTGTCFT